MDTTKYLIIRQIFFLKSIYNNRKIAFLPESNQYCFENDGILSPIGDETGSVILKAGETIITEEIALNSSLLEEITLNKPLLNPNRTLIEPSLKPNSTLIEPFVNPDYTLDQLNYIGEGTFRFKKISEKFTGEAKNIAIKKIEEFEKWVDSNIIWKMTREEYRKDRRS